MRAYCHLKVFLTATALFLVYTCLTTNTYAENVNVKVQAVIEEFDASPNSVPSQTGNSQPNHMQSDDPVDPFISENGGSKPVFKPVPGGGFGGSGKNSGFGGYAPVAQYTPNGLDQVHKPEVMPELMPGWGPFGDEYPIEGDPKWTSRRYYVPQGDVIIAINDRRTRSMKDYQTAMVKAGRYVVLTLASHDGSSAYCMCARVRNHRLPLGVADSFYGDDISDALGGLATMIINKNVKNKKDKVEYKPKERVKGVYINKCFNDFEGYIYKPTYPYPLNDE